MSKQHTNCPEKKSNVFNKKYCTLVTSMKLEKKLWDRFVQGDDAALGSLYSELFEPLVFVSFYLVKDNDVARDIVGDLFVTLLAEDVKNRKLKWLNVNAVKTYLAAAVRNKSIDYLRKYKPQERNSTRIEIEITLEENPFYAESLNLLNEDEKALFQLHLDGFKNDEIAQNYQVTEKTVRNKLSLSRKKMKSYFNSLLIFFA